MLYACKKGDIVSPEKEHETSNVVQNIRPSEIVWIQVLAKKKTRRLRCSANFAQFVFFVTGWWSRHMNLVAVSNFELILTTYTLLMSFSTVLQYFFKVSLIRSLLLRDFSFCFSASQRLLGKKASFLHSKAIW